MKRKTATSDQTSPTQRLRKPSTAGWTKKTLSKRLPIKDREGNLISNDKFPLNKKKSARDKKAKLSTSSVQDKENHLNGNRDGLPSSAPHEHLESNDMDKSKELKEETFEDKKFVIATLCESILRNPESSLFRQKIESNSDGNTVSQEVEKYSKLEALHNFLEDLDLNIKNLALLSEYAVFRDIIPAYRIRIPTEKEEQQNQSKEVLKLRKYEKTLLGAYQTYLKSLEDSLVFIGCGDGRRSVALSALRSLCGLLKAHPHFNFRSNIVLTLILHMNHKDEGTANVCYDCICYVFEKDKQGTLSLEITNGIAKFAKERKYNIKEQLLKCFMSLKLKVHEDEIKDVTAEAKKRRQKCKSKTIEYEMMAADANVDFTLMKKNHAEILKEMILMFFRVLKNFRHPNLLSVSLAGLAKFVHLINLDTVEDLMDILKELLEENKLNLEASLHCILMSYTTFQGSGREIEKDDRVFLRLLYSKILQLSESKNRNLVPLSVQCVDALFMKRRENSATRVAAFMKRLMSISMQVDVTSAELLLSMVYRLSLRYAATQQIFENENDKVTSGILDFDVDDPDHAHPYSSSAWELSLLKYSSEDCIKKAANNFENLSKLDRIDAISRTYLQAEKFNLNSSGIQTVEERVFTNIPLPSDISAKDSE